MLDTHPKIHLFNQHCPIQSRLQSVLGVCSFYVKGNYSTTCVHNIIAGFYLRVGWGGGYTVEYLVGVTVSLKVIPLKKKEYLKLSKTWSSS